MQNRYQNLFPATLVLSAGLMLLGLCLEAPLDILRGLWSIVTMQDLLITDYVSIGGPGAALVNAGLVTMLSICLIRFSGDPYNGFTIVEMGLMAGFSLFGKNFINIWPIILGTWFYARYQKEPFSKHASVALLATSLAPLVTELVFLLPFDRRINLLAAVSAGILIGFILPGLSAHTASTHMGFTLFNVGFSAGILAFVMVCILKSFGLECESVLIWREGRPLWIGMGLYGYFLLTFLYGLYLCRGQLKGLLKIWKHPGRAVADFVLMEGVGSTLMNMAMVGAACETYIYMIGGELSGPVIGAILTAFGFAAFGAHVKNYLPLLAGVFLSTFLNRFAPTTPGVQLAAIFAVGLAPIAGRFGVIAGIFAGMLHTAIAMCTSQMYGGLNLYNNGFSTGWVAMVMVPVMDSILLDYKNRKRKGKNV